MSKSFMDAIRGVVTEGAKDKTSDGMTKDAKHFAQDLHKATDPGMKHLVQKDSETKDYEKMFSGNVEKFPTRLADVEPSQGVDKYVEYNESVAVKKNLDTSTKKKDQKQSETDDTNDESPNSGIGEEHVLEVNANPRGAGGAGYSLNTGKATPIGPKTDTANKMIQANPNRISNLSRKDFGFAQTPANKPKIAAFNAQQKQQASMPSSSLGQNMITKSGYNPNVAKVAPAKPAAPAGRGEVVPSNKAAPGGARPGVVAKNTPTAAKPTPTPNAAAANASKILSAKGQQARTGGNPTSAPARTAPSTSGQQARMGGNPTSAPARTAPSAGAAKPAKPAAQGGGSAGKFGGGSGGAAKPKAANPSVGAAKPQVAKPKLSPLQQQQARSKYGRDSLAGPGNRPTGGIVTGKVTGKTFTTKPAAPAKKVAGVNTLKQSYEIDINGTSYIVSEEYAAAIAAFVEKYGEISEGGIPPKLGPRPASLGDGKGPEGRGEVVPNNGPSAKATTPPKPTPKPAAPKAQAPKPAAPAPKPTRETRYQRDNGIGRSGKPNAGPGGIKTPKTVVKPAAPAGVNKLKEFYEIEWNGQSYTMSEAQIQAMEAFIEKYGEVNEVLTKSTSAGETIKDFVHSKNPKFEGKSKKERIKQALGAYYSKQREK